VRRGSDVFLPRVGDTERLEEREREDARLDVRRPPVADQGKIREEPGLLPKRLDPLAVLELRDVPEALLEFLPKILHRGVLTDEALVRCDLLRRRRIAPSECRKRLYAGLVLRVLRDLLSLPQILLCLPPILRVTPIERRERLVDLVERLEHVLVLGAPFQQQLADAALERLPAELQH
jgi:hypothetical protein